MKAGGVYKYDLSIPVEKMYDLVEEMRVRLGKNVKNSCFAESMLDFILNSVFGLFMGCVLLSTFLVRT